MRVTGLNRAVSLTFAVLLVGGCGSLNDASETLDRASLCVDALQAAEFTPNLNDPEQTAKDAAAASQELSDLAGQAQDDAIRDALNTMSQKVGDLDTANLTVDNMQAFVDQKVELYRTLSTACQ